MINLWSDLQTLVYRRIVLCRHYRGILVFSNIIHTENNTLMNRSFCYYFSDNVITSNLDVTESHTRVHLLHVSLRLVQDASMFYLELLAILHMLGASTNGIYNIYKPWTLSIFTVPESLE